MEDFDHGVLLQELSVKNTDPVLHLLMSVAQQRQVFIEAAVW